MDVWTAKSIQGLIPPHMNHMCHGQGGRGPIGDGRTPTFNDGILIIGI